MRTRRRLILWIGLLSGLAFLLKSYTDQRNSVPLRDFKQPYASARCLAYGCDPYSEAETQKIFVEADGNLAEDTEVFVPYSALYPPPALYLLEPIGILPYPIAKRLWVALNGLAYCAAIVVIAQWCAAFDELAASLVLALFAVTSTIILGLGQVSCLSISLLVIGMGCILNRRFLWLGIACVAIAVILKPHLAGAVPLYLLVSGRENAKRFLQIAAAVTIFCAVTIAWSVLVKPGGSHWLTEMRVNIAGNTGPGSTNDPSPHGKGATSSASLQALSSLFLAAPSQYKLVAYGISAVFFLMWMYAVLRMKSGLERDLIAIGALAAIGMLPVYHRMYDSRILLFMFPAIAVLSRKSRPWRALSISMAIVITVLTSMQWERFLGFVFGRLGTPSGRVADLLFFRPIALGCFLAAGFLTAAILRFSRNSLSPDTDTSPDHAPIPVQLPVKR